MDGEPASAMFTQEHVEAPKKPMDELAAERNKTRIANRFVFGELADYPSVDNQELEYPESVVISDVRFIECSTNSEEQMLEYSNLSLSTKKRGTRVIVAETLPQWDATIGTWRILLKVHTRKFKTLKTIPYTTHEDPKEST